MDLICQKCGEPWELDYIMQELSPEQSAAFRSGKGCQCCDWGKNAPEGRPLRADAARVVSELLGDDVDGIAATLDDFSYVGLLDEQPGRADMGNELKPCYYSSCWRTTRRVCRVCGKSVCVHCRDRHEASCPRWEEGGQPSRI